MAKRVEFINVCIQIQNFFTFWNFLRWRENGSYFAFRFCASSGSHLRGKLESSSRLEQSRKSILWMMTEIFLQIELLLRKLTRSRKYFFHSTFICEDFIYTNIDGKTSLSSILNLTWHSLLKISYWRSVTWNVFLFTYTYVLKFFTIQNGQFIQIDSAYLACVELLYNKNNNRRAFEICEALL